METLFPIGREGKLGKLILVDPECQKDIVREILGGTGPDLDYPEFQVDYVWAVRLAVRRYGPLEMEEGLRRAFADVFLNGQHLPPNPSSE